MLLAVDVHEDLALEHVDRLVQVGMHVQGRRLAANHAVLPHRERAARLRRGGLHREYPATGEPEAFAFVSLPDHGNSVAHLRLLAGDNMGLWCPWILEYHYG